MTEPRSVRGLAAAVPRVRIAQRLTSRVGNSCSIGGDRTHRRFGKQRNRDDTHRPPNSRFDLQKDVFRLTPYPHINATWSHEKGDRILELTDVRLRSNSKIPPSEA